MKKSILNGLTILIVIILLLSVSTSTYAISKEEKEENKQLEMIHYNMETREETIVHLPSADEILAEVKSETKSRGNGNSRQITIDENGGKIAPYIATTEDLIMPTDIIGEENRVKVPDTTQYPYKTICLLIINYPKEIGCMGTGVLIGKKTLLTVAHNLYNKDKGGYATSIAVYPATYGTTDPYGSTAISNFYVSSAYRNATDEDKSGLLDDWAIAELYDEIGSKVGAVMGVSYSEDYSFLVDEHMMVTISGYPKDGIESSGTGFKEYYMYTDRDYVVYVDGGNFLCNADGESGQSGSPVYENPQYCIGVFMGGHKKTTNICAAITKERFAIIVAWMKQFGEL